MSTSWTNVPVIETEFLLRCIGKFHFAIRLPLDPLFGWTLFEVLPCKQQILLPLAPSRQPEALN